MKNKNPKLTSLFIFSEVIQWVPGPTYSVVTHLLMILICIHLAFLKKIKYFSTCCICYLKSLSQDNSFTESYILVVPP